MSHFILIWFSAYGTRAARFLAYAPGYDFPAILAYFSTMVSAVYFVCNLETEFYPLYRRYFGLLSGQGTLCEVTVARKEMSGSIYKGLGSCALVQCVTCLLFISAGRMILSVLNIGMTDAMLGTFQVFCVGYAFYAIGNTAQLLLIYLVDERGALYSQVLFFLLSTLGTMEALRLGQRFWGFGFLIGAAVLAVVNVLRLAGYVKPHTPLAARYTAYKGRAPRALRGKSQALGGKRPT